MHILHSADRKHLMESTTRRNVSSRIVSVLVCGALIVLFQAAVPCVEAAESTPGCGKIDKALLGRDPRVAAPWTATLLYQSNFKCGEFRQSGSGHGVIVGPTTVLMSGHFLWGSDTSNAETSRLLPFNSSNFIVALGLKSRQPFSADQYTQFLKISYIRVHSGSYERYSNNDMVILHLTNPIRYSSYVRPICLDNSPEVVITNVNSTEKLGDLTISGFNRGVPDAEPFGFLDSAICKQKLTTEYQEASQGREISKSGIPCGFSSKLREDVQSWNGYGNGLIQSRFLDPGPGKSRKDTVITNLCYQKGSSIITFYNDRWYMIGMTGESLGITCKNNNLYFISFVTYKENIDWILQNIRFSTNSFVCDNGQTIDLAKMCNDFQDCTDDSDENPKFCSAIKCGTIFSSFCTKCETKNSFQILGKTYSYSNATSSDEVKCSALKQPEGSLLHCENPIIRKRITCEYGSDPGTKAVFQCKTGKPSEPSSYCVITCKDDGNWTDELKTYTCKSNSSLGISGSSPDIVFSHGSNANWINKILLNRPENSNSNPDDDPSLDNWTPPQLSPNIGDKTGGGGGSRNCRGFKRKPGLKISCRAPGSSVSSCLESVSPGTKAEFSCEQYYRPIFSAASVIKTCQPNGQWSLENRAFECRLDCGVPKRDLVGHIVNGHVTSGTKWPWHAIMYRKTKDGQLAYICGATLISKRLLLTAAHCVTDRRGKALPNSDFAVILGATSNNLEENSGDPNSQIVSLDNITVNPAFNLNTFESDIALIRLAKPAHISDFVRPACFPSTITLHNELLHLSPGSEGHIIGFGYDESGSPSNKMREALLPVVSYSQCYDVVKVLATSSQFCAGFTNGTAACNGDSGGGMFFEDDTYPRRMYLQGIVSHGNKDDSTGLCDKNQYSIFTKVATFKNWINEIGLNLDEDF
ncbi:uncharacterized protein LOC110854409 isoform X2 [Folsomia candida]|uniref:uncharacterized protein LOC110854409 isoform X2 n=1 Tax=Folsomia candida TaxID=158441 RepID=UPI0016055516|nr:uncharacterized protein LOC110854409 isoform X2 [Folsomia candida]